MAERFASISSFVMFPQQLRPVLQIFVLDSVIAAVRLVPILCLQNDSDNRAFHLFAATQSGRFSIFVKMRLKCSKTYTKIQIQLPKCNVRQVRLYLFSHYQISIFRHQNKIVSPLQTTN